VAREDAEGALGAPAPARAPSPGDPVNDETEMGSVISHDQQERIMGFLERAKGATILTGGRDEWRPRLLRPAHDPDRRQTGG